MGAAQSKSKLTCEGCGSNIEYSAGDKALKCAHCGKVIEIAHVEAVAIAGPSLIVPLSVELSALTDAVYEHLASGDLTPDHLLEHATFTKTERFYVPAYDFDGEYSAVWTASFGYDRQEHYTAYETRTENGRTHRVPVTRTKTVTDWRAANGNDSGTFSVRSYAGRRLIDAGSNLTSLVENMPEVEHAPYDASFTIGVPVEEVSTSSEAAFTDCATPRINQIIDQSVRQHAQGDHQKDWHWKGSVSKRATSLLVPVCHAVYEFEGKQFNVWVSGNDTSRMVADPLPVDKRRKLAISLGFIPVLFSAVASGLAVFMLDSAWGLPLSVIAVAAGYGVLRKKIIISYSRKIRKALLATKNAASSNTAQMSAEEQKSLTESFKQPSKPWLANSAMDKFVLPIAAVLAAIVPFGASIHLPHRGMQDSSTSVRATEGIPATSEPQKARLATRSAQVAAAPAPQQVAVAETHLVPAQAPAPETEAAEVAQAQAQAQAEAVAEAQARAAQAQPQATQGGSDASQNAQLQAMYSMAVDAMHHGQYDRASGIADSLIALAPGNAQVLRLKQDIRTARQNAINRIQIQ
jgi:hypothetical protein